MATAVSVDTNYINAKSGIASWAFTVVHKRIGIM